MPHALFPSELPLIAAPMAGGATTVELAAAASGAGAFAFLAAGYKSPEALAEQLVAARDWAAPFGVNLFVPSQEEVDAAAFARYARAIEVEAAEYGLALSETPHVDDDHWGEKIAMLVEDPVPVISFTFGLPAAQEIAALRRAGSAVLVSVTTPEEARAAEEAGADGLVVQGPRAGGHSASWDARREISDGPTGAVLASVRAVTGLPLVAAGGVDGPEAVRALLSGGADAVAVGTLLLRSDESGASEPHRAALASPRFAETAVTRTFTGRPARGLRNGFIDRHEREAITAYPAVHHLTRELRSRATAAGDTDRMHLWAGTGFRAARTGPAAEIVRELVSAL